MIKNLLKNIDIDIPNTTPLIVGTSAGPDSMALIHYLKNNTKNPIICAHINHNIRKESAKEAEYLKKYCKQNNITFESITIKKYNKGNFENQARQKRYSFYEQTLKKYNSKYLFLAHHGDDLIETILMKIVRGSDIEGYAGIKKISLKKDYYIIRPLLDYTKEDLIHYNKIHNIKYFIDKSNYDQKYTRNRYRHNILPLLKEENQEVHKQFLKYSNTLQEYNNYVTQEVNTNLKKVYTPPYIELNKFKTLHPLIQKNIIYQILKDTYKNKNSIIKERNITSILNLMNSQKPNLSINLPNNIIAKKEYNKLYITENNTSNYPTHLKIPLEDTTIINNITIKKINYTEEDGNDICRLNHKNITPPLYIRYKKPGDYIEVLGLNGKKKISEIFIENKVPLEKRNTFPILVDANDNIIWLPSLKKSKFNAKKNEFCDIILKYCEKGGKK